MKEPCPSTVGYLCAKPLVEPTDVDHVPAKCLFAPSASLLINLMPTRRQTPTGHYWALMFWDKIIITVALVIPSKRGNRGFHCRHPESSTLENARLFAADPIAIREA